MHSRMRLVALTGTESDAETIDPVEEEDTRSSLSLSPAARADVFVQRQARKSTETPSVADAPSTVSHENRGSFFRERTAADVRH